MTVTMDEECNCDDPRYSFQITVAGTVVHEATLNLENGDGDPEMARVTAEQMPLVDAAIAQGKPWVAKSWCPGCGKGQVIVSNRVRALNLLPLREDDDPRELVVADCGHDCIATYVTRRRMADPDVDNITVCIPCFEADPDRWRNA